MEVLQENEEVERTAEDLRSLNMSDSLQDMEKKEEEVPSDVPAFDWSSIDTSHLPPSYKTNSRKEKKMLCIADHFLQQFTHLYPDRKPLFLHAANECGVQKFVSTTVRPTPMPYPELYDWSGCASFVSNYLTMEPLKCPITPPISLYSPTTILKYQRGNCFDFSVLLCSMLIGAGYDAYCVHGYATREICTLDQTHEVCPLLKKPQELCQVPVMKPKKYRLSLPSEPQSKFELQQKAKKKEEAEDVQKEEEVVTEVEKPKREPLHGLRVHAWVLVLSGKRKVPETFFINPFTGNSHNTTDECFLGIESIWNDSNYWVNMQDCRKGCKELSFDLSDAIRWKIMLPESNELFTDSSERDMYDAETRKRHMSFDMPLSWVARLEISYTEIENQYAKGKKVILYEKAKLEKWAPYANKNGLMERLTVYKDLECTEVEEVREWFTNRTDMLERREMNKQTQLTTDYFGRHPLLLKAHTYTSLEAETGHTMEFNHKSRADELQKRVETATEMTEYYVGRDDFLHTRHVKFGERANGMDMVGTRTDTNLRPILEIKEHFHRNLEKPADEDVKERIFTITNDSIQLTYYLEDYDIFPSKVVFLKAIQRDRKGEEIFVTKDTCVKYKPWSSEKHKNVRYLYTLLRELRMDQMKLMHQVRKSEAEVLKVLKVRKDEEANVKLTVSMYTLAMRGHQHEAMALEKQRKSSQCSLENKDCLSTGK